MGAYNVLNVTQECPNCKSKVEFKIQFKYGDTWQYDYFLGNKIRWGGNDTGIPNLRKVILDGISEPCTRCGNNIDFEILIENDIVKSVEPATGKYNFCQEQESYIILEK